LADELVAGRHQIVRTLERVTLDEPGAPVFDLVRDQERLRATAKDLERWAAFRGTDLAFRDGRAVIGETPGELVMYPGPDGRYAADILDHWVPA
jgi:hypothetical protein